jgi:hypothetical protein
LFSKGCEYPDAATRGRWNRCLIQQQIAARRPVWSSFTINMSARCFTGCLGISVKIWHMNVHAAAKELNRKAAEQKWHHFCDPTLAFSDSLHEQFLSLWQSKVGARAMPARSEMAPRDLKDFLRNIVLFEREEVRPSRYRWRIIGTGITELLGHHTGKTFEESIPAEHRPRWIECFDLILDGGKPLRFLGRVHFRGREYLNAEHLYVPLANNDGEPSFIMGLCRYTPRRSENEESWESQIASIPGGLL